MNQCPVCGKQYPDEINVCAVCGRPLTPPDAETESRSPALPILVAVGIGVVVITTIVIIILAVSGKGDGTPPTSIAAVEEPSPSPGVVGKTMHGSNGRVADGLGLDEGNETEEPEETAEPTEKPTPTEAPEDEFGPGDRDNYTYDKVTNEWLEESEVSSLSSEQKRYYVNTLFAAYGYRFTNDKLQRFFEFQDWYVPDYTYEPGDQDGIATNFDDTARHNLQLLRA